MRRVLKPEHVTAIIDTREKRPFDLSPLKTEPGKLVTGDYSVKGLEHFIAIERKSLQDLVMCCGSERVRFAKACQRLMAYPCRAIVVEATWHDLEAGKWHGTMTPNAVCGSVLGWIAMGLPIIMGHNANLASRQVSRLLFIAARRRYEELLMYQDIIDGQ